MYLLARLESNIFEAAHELMKCPQMPRAVSSQSYIKSYRSNTIIYAHREYTNSGFSLSVKSSHSWFSSFTYSGCALSTAFLAFCRLQYQ
jgi:hypothetical protein